MLCDSERLDGNTGNLMEIAIKVIANANIASPKDVTCSNRTLLNLIIVLVTLYYNDK
jgi:hypothetical protein